MNRLQVALLITISIFVVIGQIECASKCYKCAGFTCYDNSTETCSTNTSFCQRVTTVTAGITVIVKGCSTSCIDGDSATFGPTTVKFSCCTNDLCNTFQASSGVSTFDLSLKTQLITLSIILMSIINIF